MENIEKEVKKQNKEARKIFEALTTEEQIKYANKAIEKVGTGNDFSAECDFSYAYARGILADKGVYYNGTLKKFVKTVALSDEEVEFVKSLYNNKDKMNLEEVEKEMTLEDTVEKKINRFKEVSQNRSFYISDNVFFKFKAFCNIQKSVTNKQLMELALVELMEKFPMDKAELEIAYQEVLKENDRIKSKNTAKKKDEAVDDDRFCD